MCRCRVVKAAGWYANQAKAYNTASPTGGQQCWSEALTAHGHLQKQGVLLACKVPFAVQGLLDA